MITEAMIIGRILNITFYILMAYAVIFIAEIAFSFTLELPMLSKPMASTIWTRRIVHMVS